MHEVKQRSQGFKAPASTEGAEHWGPTDNHGITDSQAPAGATDSDTKLSINLQNPFTNKNSPVNFSYCK